MDVLYEAIYDRFIKPTDRRPSDAAGIEFELPIVNLSCRAVDFELIQRVTRQFINRFAFEDISYDDEDRIYNAAEAASGDTLSYDCSFNTLEFSFGPDDNINNVATRFYNYYSFIESLLLKENHTLTGMGVNPYRYFNRKEPIKSERYRMLLHHLSSFGNYRGEHNFHEYPDFGLFSAANQVQLDVAKDTITDTVNIFGKLEPFKALLLANSVLLPDKSRLLCRDYLWEDSLHGLNSHNVGLLNPVLSRPEDIINYYKTVSIYCVMRAGLYLNFRPVPLYEYFSRERITGEFWNGNEYEEITFTPDIEDLKYVRTFKFEDLTYRGTIEFRSVCEQPVSEIFASPALHAGLARKLPELKVLLDSDTSLYGKGYTTSELRRMCCMRELPDIFDRKAISGMLIKILNLAAKGLSERGKNEEHFLEPLFARAERLESPALEMVRAIENGTQLEDYILKYSVSKEVTQCANYSA